MSEKLKYRRVTNKCCEDWNKSGCFNGKTHASAPQVRVRAALVGLEVQPELNVLQNEVESISFEGQWEREAAFLMGLTYSSVVSNIFFLETDSYFEELVSPPENTVQHLRRKF